MRYKPWTSFEINLDLWGYFVEISVVEKVKDADKFKEQNMNVISVQCMERIPVLDFIKVNEESLISIIQSSLKKIAAHEVDEWFRLDDRQVTDPHPELKQLKKAHDDMLDVMKYLTFKDMEIPAPPKEEPKLDPKQENKRFFRQFIKDRMGFKDFYR